LPEPLSPRISTVTSWAATRPIALYTSCIAGQRPTRTSARSSAGRLGLEDSGHVAEPAHLAGPLDQRPQRLQLQRLEQVVEGPDLHRLDGGVGGAVAGDEDHRDARVELPDALERLQPRLVGELDVEDDDVRPPRGDECQPLGGRGGGQHFHLRAAKGSPKGVLNRQLVVDDQDHRHTSSSLVVSR